MQVVEAASWSSKPHNEDACGFRADGVWVIDGATALGPTPVVDGLPAPAWLSSAASGFLRDVSWEGRDLAAVVAGLIRHVSGIGHAAGLGTAACDFPTAAISLARQRAGTLELLLLGDCPVVVTCPDGSVEVIVDPQFARAEDELLRPVRASIADGAEPAAVYRDAQRTLRQRRRTRNTPEGLWILGDVPEAVRHAHVRTIPLRGGEELTIMSDGFARLVEPFDLVGGYRALAKAVAAGEAAALFRRLRAAELADPDRGRHPRFSVTDDATVIHARL